MGFTKLLANTIAIALLVQSLNAAPTPDSVASVQAGGQTQVDCISTGCFYSGTGTSVPSSGFIRENADGTYTGVSSDLKEEQFTATMVATHKNINPAWHHFDTLSSVTFYGAAFREFGAASDQDKVASGEMAQCGESYEGNGQIHSVVVADGASLMLAGGNYLTIKNMSGHTVYVPIDGEFGTGTQLICSKN